MDRLACVDVPALPLQVLLQQRPQWRQHPVAVVAEDKPLAPILWVNRQALGLGIRPGLKYAEGLALCNHLRGTPVSGQQVAAAVDRLTAALRQETPGVEPGEDQPGIFWLDASGLEQLYTSPRSWARALLRQVDALGFSARVAVGFSRFGTYALARTAGAQPAICQDLAEERAATRAVPLSRLFFADPRLAESLSRLGVLDVGALLELPAAGVLERFGPAAHRLHQLASDSLYSPLQPRPECPPVEQVLPLDDPETNLTRLLFRLKRGLDALLRILAGRQQLLACLVLELRQRGGARDRQELRPARPTLDGVQLMELVRLRLESLRPLAPVTDLRLEAEPTPAHRKQLQLFAQRPRWSRKAADRALARLRAELGQAAVVRAVLQDEHLPEASFGWEPLETLPHARPAPTACQDSPRPMVRRLLPTPVELRGTTGTAASLASRPLQSLGGPYLLSGGWWNHPVQREYHYLQAADGRILYVYLDGSDGRAWLHGTVE